MQPSPRDPDELEHTVDDHTCQLIQLRQKMDDNLEFQRERFDAVISRLDKSDTQTDTRFDKVDDRFDKVDDKFDKHAAHFLNLLEKVEARLTVMIRESEARLTTMIEQSEARIMAALAQLEMRVDKLETGFRWLVGLQVATLLGVIGVLAELI